MCLDLKSSLLIRLLNNQFYKFDFLYSFRPLGRFRQRLLLVDHIMAETMYSEVLFIFMVAPRTLTNIRFFILFFSQLSLIPSA